MRKTTTALASPLRDQLDRLARFEPTDWPVLSLYLDMRADQHGRQNYDAFLRKTLAERSRMFKGKARASFDRDVERINEYLANDARRSANGIAVFACSAAGEFFDAVQIDAPLDQHWLFIGSVPHLYPLAKLNDQYPRYAAVVVDTNAARIFVFGLGAAERTDAVTNVKTRKTSIGGWSQARYQRHAENFHLHHMKEVAAVLDRVVREERLNQVVVACDPTAQPLFMEQLPQHLADKVVDVMSLDINAPVHHVLTETLDALRRADSDSDVEHVEALLDAWGAGGLGVVGPEATLDALERGQVEELLITAAPDRLRPAARVPQDTAPGPVDVDTSAPHTDIDTNRLKLADELITRAQQNSARIRFIEDPELLDAVGGVGALLRFRI